MATIVKIIKSLYPSKG